MLVDAQQRIHHDFGIAGIQRRDRLIGKDDVGLLNQRPRNRNALLLPAGELVGTLRGQLSHVELLKGRHRQRLVLFGPKLCQRAPGRDVREPSHQNVGQHIKAANQIELLENHRRPCAPLPQTLAAQRCHVQTFEQDSSLRWVGEAIDHSQQSRLAGPGTADHTDKAARRDRE